MLVEEATLVRVRVRVQAQEAPEQQQVREQRARVSAGRVKKVRAIPLLQPVVSDRKTRLQPHVVCPRVQCQLGVILYV